MLWLWTWLLAAVCPLISDANADVAAWRHDVSLGISRNSESSVYDQYRNNDELRTDKTENTETTAWGINGSYALFLKPLREKPDVPHALQRFYAHPSLIQASFDVQPDIAITNLHRDPAFSYQREISSDGNSRYGSLFGEWYALPSTALLLLFDAQKQHEHMTTSWTLGSEEDQGTGEDTDQVQQYGLGVSHYFSKALNLRVLYVLVDGESRREERTWAADHPILYTDSYLTSTTDGKRVVVSGEYIHAERWGLRGRYEFSDSDKETHFWSVYADNFPGVDTSSVNDATGHRWQALFSWYADLNTTFRLGAGYALHHAQQTHETNQIDEYDWNRFSLEFGLCRYVNRHIGISVGYTFARQSGDVLIWYLHNANAPHTTYETTTDIHSLYFQLNVRL